MGARTEALAERIEVVGTLVVVAAGLRVAGWPALWAAVRDLPRAPTRGDPQRLARRVERMGRWIPGARLCLPQAVGLAALYRRHGIDGQLVIGVRGTPFQAHAWIERGSEVLIGAEARPGFRPIWRGRW